MTYVQRTDGRRYVRGDKITGGDMSWLEKDGRGYVRLTKQGERICPGWQGPKPEMPNTEKAHTSPIPENPTKKLHVLFCTRVYNK